MVVRFNRYHSNLCLNLNLRQTCNVIVVVVNGNLNPMVSSYWGGDSCVYLINVTTWSKGTRSVYSFFKLIDVSSIG